MQTDICIIGAGPAGVAAALQLNKSGIPCLLIDKSSFPREKVCGDGFSPKVSLLLNRIDPGILERFKNESGHLESWGGIMASPDGDQFMANLKKNKPGENNPCFVSRRFDFDHFLINEVQKHPGIQFLENTQVDTFERKEGQYFLFGKNGETIAQAKLLIVANGAHSTFTKKIAGIQMEHHHYAAAIRTYYDNVEGLHPDNLLEFHFLKELLPGYLWIFPSPGGLANVGIYMHTADISKKKANLKELLFKIVQEHPSISPRFRHASLQGKIEGYGLPLGSKKRNLSGDHYLLAGDAAYLVEPFSGEGIGNAIYSGIIAADQAAAAVKAGDFSAGFLKDYDARIYRVMGPELRFSRQLTQILRRPFFVNMIVRLARLNSKLPDLISVKYEKKEFETKFRNPFFYVWKYLIARSKH